MTGVSSLLGHHGLNKTGREIRNEILRETMKQYENEQDGQDKSLSKISFWTRFKPARKRRLKKTDDNNVHNPETRVTNMDYIVNGLPFRKANNQGQIESTCNGHTVCDNIAIDDDEDDNDEVVVQVVDNFDNIMAVREGQENINRHNTPSTSRGYEMTHI